MTTEAEILNKHTEALLWAREMCRLLALNADPDKAAPRGHQYGNLRRALKELEGSCRQMNYMREDTRWIRLGVLYAKAMRTAFDLYRKQSWAAFGQLSQLFENGIVRMKDLAEKKTGQSGAILPKRPSDWLVMPDRPLPGFQRQRALVH